VTIGDYMVTMLGLYNYTIEGGATAYSTKVNILDMKEWKWVDSISQEAVSSATEGTASCNFTMPNVNGDLTYEPFNYDESVIVNPNQSSSQDDSTKKKEGFGIGFGLLVLILIVGGVWFYIRRLRKKNRPAANPRWARNNSGQHQGQSDYPLYVYNKELEEGGNVQASSRAFAPNDIKTYTASDHDQWEQQVGTNHTDNNDIWKRMHGLNDAPILNDEQIYQNRHHRDTAKEEGYSKLVDTE
jgi:hypothetical protein